jgi:hypothetical protein
MEVTMARKEVVVDLFDFLEAHRPVKAKRPLRASPKGGASDLSALVDEHRIVLESKDEIVLRCGKASITLRRNGLIVLKGTYLESQSEGVNRIKGGSVKIN